MSEITPDELDRRLRADGEDVLVLDIRHREDFEEWHVPGSTNVDVYDRLVDEPETARDALADLQRGREDFVETLASDVPDHLPNFERVKRVNVGRESVADAELSDLELGPNNCAAE